MLGYGNGYLSPFAELSVGSGVAVLSDAYERTLRKLNLVDRRDPITEMMAKKIIELGQRGVREAKQLSELAIKELGTRARIRSISSLLYIPPATKTFAWRNVMVQQGCGPWREVERARFTGGDGH